MNQLLFHQNADVIPPFWNPQSKQYIDELALDTKHTPGSPEVHTKTDRAPLTAIGRPHGCALLTVEDVATILQVSPAWVRDHATRRQPLLPVVRIGKLLRFRAADVDRWIEEQMMRAC